MKMMTLLRIGKSRGLIAAALILQTASLGAAALPITGSPVPELSAFDVAVTNFMRANAIKGGALAVMKDGRLVFLHGYGFRDQAQTIPFDPDTRVRIASNSKTFTAAAIKVLMERGLIASNTLAVPFAGIRPFTGVFGDPRYGQIEVQHLVAHRSGFEPNDSWFDSATAMGLDRIQTAAEEISWRFTLPLEFTPGSGSAYSGQGYALLGRVIEKASGLDFVTFVQRNVARTWGVPGVQLERTEPKLRALDESWHDGALSPSGLNLVNFPSAEIVPGPDGGAFVLESGDAPGGLITSVRGLVTLAQAALVSHGTFFAPQATIPTVLHGDRRRFRHLPGVGAQSGWEPGARSFNLQNTNGVDLAVFFNLEIQEPTFGDFVAQLKRLTETTAVWPGDNSTRIELAANSFSVVENEGILVIGVRRTGDSAGVVSANYTTMPGTALSGTEFTAVSGKLTFGNDEITQVITIPILDNATAGPAKSFSVVLSDPTGGAVLGITSATVTIEDDDNRQPPSIAISLRASGTSFAQGAEVAITASPGDIDGTIYTVKFFAGPTLIGEENKPPYTFRWSNPGAGHRQRWLDGDLGAGRGDRGRGIGSEFPRNHSF